MLVLTRNEDGQYQVADGQQRLATISVLIAAVRDYLLELGDTDGALLYQNRYLLDYDPRKRDYLPKLMLNYEDHDYFYCTILKSPKDRTRYDGRHFGSHDRLRQAFSLANEQVRNIAAAYPVAEKPGRLYDWVDFLQNTTKVIIITVPGRIGNAYKMFDTLNARGMPASQLDILKNYLFGWAKDVTKDVHPSWISMKSTIEDLGEDDLLITYVRHFWISQSGPTKENQLGAAIEEKVRTERQAVDLIRGLDASAGLYAALLSPRDHPRLEDFGHDTRNYIHAITQDLKIEQVRPLLMAILRNFTAVEAQKALKLILSWSVRFLIAGGGGGGVLDRQYSLRASEVSARDIDTARALRESMKEFVPNDELFRRAFETASVRRKHLARYYLRAIEMYLENDTKPQFVPTEDTTAVNLEHVLPVRPSEGWDIEQDIAEAYHKRLGNMVLMGAEDNVAIGNLPFSEKRLVYEQSQFEITKAVGKYERWHPADIESHQIDLARVAPLVWPLSWK